MTIAFDFPASRRAAAVLALVLAWEPGAALAGAPQLVHEDDFARRPVLDPAFWSAETGLFRNHEAQYYQPRNARLDGGLLRLEARRERVANAGYRADGQDWPATARTADYTSASIVSREAFLFGAFEIVARLPQTPGAWPAIWLISERGRPYREIDMVEAVASAPGTAFTTVNAGPDLANLRTWKAETALPSIASAFHAYRLDWRPDAIVLSIDGRPVLRVNPEDARAGADDPLRAPMHLRINLALGGSWGGRIDDAQLPARLDVTSIRIWRVEDR